MWTFDVVPNVIANYFRLKDIFYFKGMKSSSRGVSLSFGYCTISHAWFRPIFDFSKFQQKSITAYYNFEFDGCSTSFPSAVYEPMSMITITSLSIWESGSDPYWFRPIFDFSKFQQKSITAYYNFEFMSQWVWSSYYKMITYKCPYMRVRVGPLLYGSRAWLLHNCCTTFLYFSNSMTFPFCIFNNYSTTSLCFRTIGKVLVEKDERQHSLVESCFYARAKFSRMSRYCIFVSDYGNLMTEGESWVNHFWSSCVRFTSADLLTNT